MYDNGDGPKAMTDDAKHRVVSISLDDSIVTEDGWSRQRQREYAGHFEEYIVVVKTENEGYDTVEEGPLTVIPTNSQNRYAFVIDAYRTVVDVMRDTDTEVITVQNPFALGLLGWLIKRRTGASLHTQVHVDFLDNPNWVGGSHKRQLFSKLGRWIIQRSDAIRVGTEHEQEKIRALVGPEVPVHCAPVQINAETLTDKTSPHRQRRTRRELELDDRPVVLFAGRFVPPKNLRQFVAVADRVVDRSSAAPVFLIAGDGPLRDEVVAAVQAHGLKDHFRFPGYVSDEMLSTYYDIADVCLLTSDFEGTCRVLVEAGLNEVPVVVTPFAGAHDNVNQGETGFVESDTSALADRVVELLEDDEKRRTFGRRNREALEEQFDSERLVREYVEFLRPV